MTYPLHAHVMTTCSRGSSYHRHNLFFPWLYMLYSHMQRMMGTRCQNLNDISPLFSEILTEPFTFCTFHSGSPPLPSPCFSCFTRISSDPILYQEDPDFGRPVFFREALIRRLCIHLHPFFWQPACKDPVSVSGVKS